LLEQQEQRTQARVDKEEVLRPPARADHVSSMAAQEVQDWWSFGITRRQSVFKMGDRNWGFTVGKHTR